MTFNDVTSHEVEKEKEKTNEGDISTFQLLGTGAISRQFDRGPDCEQQIDVSRAC
jgi:hypothetical protein